VPRGTVCILGLAPQPCQAVRVVRVWAVRVVRVRGSVLCAPMSAPSSVRTDVGREAHEQVVIAVRRLGVGRR
jgi:hypothetical protein